MHNLLHQKMGSLLVGFANGPSCLGLRPKSGVRAHKRNCGNLSDGVELADSPGGHVHLNLDFRGANLCHRRRKNSSETRHDPRQFQAKDDQLAVISDIPMSKTKFGGDPITLSEQRGREDRPALDAWLRAEEEVLLRRRHRPAVA
jgi:hypothetical protein